MRAARMVKTSQRCVNHVTFFLIYVTILGSTRTNFEINLKIENMPILTVLIVLIIAGVILYLVNNYIPMDGKIKNILNVVVVLVVIVWLLKIFGVFTYLKDISI
jgi:hypothetical protein